MTALDGLTLSVPRGSIFALVGPNGAGKSTTVKILTTLAVPDAGTAAVEGIDVIAAPAGPPRHRRRRPKRRRSTRPPPAWRTWSCPGHLYGMATKTGRPGATSSLNASA